MLWSIFFCSGIVRKLLLEGELVTANTRFEKQFEFPYDNPVSVSLTNEVYIPLSDCENNHLQNLFLIVLPFLRCRRVRT